MAYSICKFCGDFAPWYADHCRFCKSLKRAEIEREAEAAAQDILGKFRARLNLCPPADTSEDTKQ